MVKYMSTSRWIVFNNTGKKLKTVTLKHKDGAVYRELEPFETKLKKQGLYAHRAECFKQFPKGMSFIQKLKCLGWEFNEDGAII